MKARNITYKDSGIKWLGEIPEHWGVARIKYLAELSTGDSIKDSDKDKYCSTENAIPYISTKDIARDSCCVDYDNGMYIPNNDSIFQRASKNSTLICLEGGSAGRKIAFLNQEVCFVNKLCCIKSVDEGRFYSKIFFYFFQTQFFYQTFHSNIKGLIGGVTTEQVGNFYIPFPPIEEQKAIAEFLDKKCGQIDSMIEKKEKFITLIEEKKQALINEMVTKGLNPSIPLKDSGITWLGQIPEHWETTRLANLGLFTKGGNISRQDLTNDGESAILYGDIYTKYQIKSFSLESKISQDASLSAKLIYKGDILFAGSGETKEDIGKNIVYLGDEKAFAGGDVIIFRQNKAHSLFLSYVLSAQYVQAYKNTESKGEIIVHIYASSLREIKIPLPPLEEQKAITEFLDKRIEKIDSIITKTKEQIKLFKEYKQTLISEAVCGRMEIK